jgi:hypothetical protein
MRNTINKIKLSRISHAAKKQAYNRKYYLKKKEKQNKSNGLAQSNKTNYTNVETFLSGNIDRIRINESHEHSSNIIEEVEISNDEKVNRNEKYSENEEFTKLFDDSQDYLVNNENEIYEEKNQTHDFIFNGSRLTLKEFNLTFRWVCQKMRLSKINRNLLLTFIKTILPTNNHIPTSYYLLLKSLKRKSSCDKKTFKICSKCYDPYKNGCENVSCNNLKKQHSIDALVFDFEYHLKFIVTKFWKEIQNYKGNLFTEFLDIFSIKI